MAETETQRLRAVVSRFVILGEALLKLDNEAGDWWAWQHEWGTAWEDGPLKLRLKALLKSVPKGPVQPPPAGEPR